MYIFHLPLDLTMAGVVAGHYTIIHNTLLSSHIMNVKTLDVGVPTKSINENKTISCPILKN